MHQCIKFILFWNDTLHVSDGLSVHHHQYKTVNTATDICQTDTADCWQSEYLFDVSISLLAYHAVSQLIIYTTVYNIGTAVRQWLRCCSTIRKVAGSIPAGVNVLFIDIKSFRLHPGPGVDSASNRNDYQEYFLGLKAAGG